MTTQQAFALALQHHHAGRLGDAEALYRQILAVQPNHADALHHLGVVAHQSGRYDLAAQWIGQAISLNPDNPSAHSNLGAALTGQERFEEAAAAYRRALRIKPDSPEAHLNLGLALSRQGQRDEAIAAFRRALEFRPGYLEAHYNLANTLRERGQLGEAIETYRRVIALQPNYPEACNNLGNTLRADRRFDEAVAAFRRALELQPNYSEAYNNLGNTLRDQGQFDEAIAAYQRALELQPDFAPAHNNLGTALKDQGRLNEAIAAHRKALELQPDSPETHSNLIYTLHLRPGEDGRTTAEEHRRWNRQFCEPLRRFILPHANDRNPGRRLRIGYVSPDFRDHVVARNLMPLFRCHDREQFEILCYSGVVRSDEMTEEFRQCAHRWCDTTGISDEGLAEIIRTDGVDILVDLALHTGGNRLPVFARQPAPVQVSFAGYPGSTGLETIGYRMSDRYLELEIGDGRSEIGAELRSPNSHLRPATQEQVFLIDSFWCYDPCGAEVKVKGLPTQEAGHLTFGSLNTFSKVNEPVLRLWARVLRAVKDASLVLLTGPGGHRQRTLDILEQEQIESHRLEFVEPRPRRQYLELYHRLDVVLDTFPYNGHTTSLDALWMGVPVVSLVGEQIVSRAGWSQLSNLGLQELVAFSEDDYVRIAAQLAHDLPRLAKLRATLRRRMEDSPLMDSSRFAHNIEAAYRAMWRQWCGEKQP